LKLLVTLSLVAALLSTPTLKPAYCPHPARSKTSVAHFIKTHPLPSGTSRDTMVVDHVKPLCACGLDDPKNMQWQSKRESMKKDKLEWKLCDSLAKATKKVK
jgi:hypothetical protein